ncbi:MAG: hypothetical protein DSY47_02760 [Hydrogenothermus sp.]|nr:MAG: hypothetical protein DSY47_02760 [Hydrogenothermus sp.]
MLKNLIVLSYEKALNFNPKNYGKTAIIRISSKEFSPLKYKDKFIAILELNFLDITEEDFYTFTPEEIEDLKIYCPNPYPISTYQAQQIVNFIRKYIEEIDTLVIHCDEGVSRSQAVAFIVAKYFLKNNTLANEIHRNFNP